MYKFNYYNTQAILRRISIMVFVWLVLLLCLGAQYFCQLLAQSVWLKPWSSILLSYFNSVEKQWVLVASASCYFVWFVIFQYHLQRQATSKHIKISEVPIIGRLRPQEMALYLFIGFAMIAYVSNYPASTERSDCLVLIAGAILGQAMRTLRWWCRHKGHCENILESVLYPLIIILSFASLYHPDMGQKFEYHGQTRWIGPYVNPNTFGMLMGVGVITALGLCLGKITFTKTSETEKWAWRQVLFAPFKVSSILYLIAVLAMGIGLIKSYSRGAWIGALCGSIYMGYVWKRAALLNKCQTMTAFCNGFASLHTRLFKRSQIGRAHV